jgi:hypothetical protein
MVLECKVCRSSRRTICFVVEAECQRKYRLDGPSDDGGSGKEALPPVTRSVTDLAKRRLGVPRTSAHLAGASRQQPRSTRPCVRCQARLSPSSQLLQPTSRRLTLSSVGCGMTRRLTTTCTRLATPCLETAVRLAHGRWRMRWPSKSVQPEAMWTCRGG